MAATGPPTARPRSPRAGSAVRPVHGSRHVVGEHRQRLPIVEGAPDQEVGRRARRRAVQHTSVRAPEVRFGARQIVVLAPRPEERRHVVDGGEARLDQCGSESLARVHADLRGTRSRRSHGGCHRLPARDAEAVAQLGSRALEPLALLLRQRRRREESATGAILTRHEGSEGPGGRARRIVPEHVRRRSEAGCGVEGAQARFCVRAVGGLGRMEEGPPASAVCGAIAHAVRGALVGQEFSRRLGHA
jgi:hypothetical protein